MLRAEHGRLSSPSQSLVIAFCSPGVVHHLDGSALAYLVGINQLARRDRPETVVDQVVHSHEPGAANWTKAHGNRRFEFPLCALKCHFQLFKRLQTRSNIFISDQTGLIPTQNRVYWLSWPSSARALGGALVQFAAWLVGVNGPIDDSLGLIAAYKLIYANQIG